MKETFIHFIWQNRLLSPELLTTSREKLHIIKPGIYNKDEGPDFLQAEIRIGETRLFGSIELHLKTSDWHHHKHEKNKNYQNVILHVVWINDRPFEEIPTLELSKFVKKTLIEKYIHFELSEDLPCGNKIKSIPQFEVKNWLNRLLINRLETKSEAFRKLLLFNLGDIEKTAIVWLIKQFGFQLNNLAFEQLGQQIDISIVKKIAQNLEDLEAYLFGMAGFISENQIDEYTFNLHERFAYLRSKFNLPKPIPINWKLLRTRPANFPTLRLAQFSAMLHNHSSIWQYILEASNYSALKQLFSHAPNKYWENHYHFRKTVKSKNAELGEKSVDLLIINGVVPALVGYGRWTGNDLLIEKAIGIIESIKAEDNKHLRDLIQVGFTFRTAGETQAAIELYKNYCVSRKCLECTIGKKILFLA